MIDLTDTDRYASPEMVQVWSEDNRLRLQRIFWLNHAKVVYEAGEMTENQYRDYEQVHLHLSRGAEQSPVVQTGSEYHNYRHYLEGIAATERITRHDLKAHLEVFDRLAGGHGKLHLGLTSSDVTENITQWQQRHSLQLLKIRTAIVLHCLAEQIRATRDTVMVGRTHNVPAQPILLASRFARCASQMLWTPGVTIRQRGVKGAVGNLADLQFVDGLDSESDWPLTGQSYPRFQDQLVGQYLQSITAPPADLAVTLRLMAGHGLVCERPRDGQVGSSAMPHKRNMRYTERINGLRAVLQGYCAMVQATGPSWNEGDVSDSVTRRIALPGMFLAADALLRTFTQVLQRLEFDQTAIARECKLYAVEVGTGQVLAAMVQQGVPREQAHRMIADAYQASQGGDYPFEYYLGDESGLRMEQVAQILDDPSTGQADAQIELTLSQIGQQDLAITEEDLL